MALCQGLLHFRAARVAFHAGGVGLRIGEDLPIGANHGHAHAVRADFRNPALQIGGIFRILSGGRRKFRRLGLRIARNDGQFPERRAFGIAIQSALGEKIRREQHARKQRDKRQC